MRGRIGYAPFSRRITQYQLPPSMRGSSQRLPITLRFTRVLGTFSHTTCFPFSCALWACFSDRSVSGERSEPMGALMPHAAIPFRPHHRFAVPLPRSRRGGFSFTACRFLSPMRGTRAAAKYRRSVKGLRYFSFPRRCGGSGEHSEPIGALMPHAALWVVQLYEDLDCEDAPKFQCRTRLCGWCSFFNDETDEEKWEFQCRTRLCGWCSGDLSTRRNHRELVSMPHAALWVVQHEGAYRLIHPRGSFNAARGFVGGAAA